MSFPQRGQEITLRISVDGRTQAGSMIKIKEWTTTPRSDVKEEDFLGEDESDLDFQHHGFDFAFSVRQQDTVALDFLDNLIQREQDHDAPPDVTVTAIYSFRQPGVRNRIYVYHDAVIKMAEEGFADRKESVMIRFEGKAKTRTPIAA